MLRISAPIIFAALLTAAQAAPPQQQWAKGIAEGNAAWATVKHAILKIQDAAYLRDGDAVSLAGRAGTPESWRWSKGELRGAALVVRLAGGHPQIAKAGKPVPPESLAKGIDIAPGIDVTGAPTQVAAGVWGIRVFVFNQNAKAAKAFKGVEVFPYDAAWRVTARFKPDPKLTPHAFRTSRGTDKQFFHAGDATFALMGKTVVLPFYADTNVPAKIASMTAFFTDGLTGRGAYGAGRYVDAETFGKFPPSVVTVDFNFAYNPNCARSPFFTCPIAIDNIPLAVRAGEKDPHAH